MLSKQALQFMYQYCGFIVDIWIKSLLTQHATCPVCRHRLSSASPETASATRPPFYFTEQNGLDPVELRTTVEEPGNIAVNLNVHPPWNTTRSAAMDDDADSNDSEVLANIEMVTMDNNIAMETEFGGRYETRRPVPESFSASSEISGMLPASELVCLGDVEVTGVEYESDLWISSCK